jgi:hypothetical protein
MFKNVILLDAAIVIVGIVLINNNNIFGLLFSIIPETK